MKSIFLSLLIFTLASCAKLEGEEAFETSERLISSIQTYGYIISGTQAYCTVAFRDPDTQAEYYLETDSVVACGGQLATKSGSSYYAYFDRGTDTGPVMVSVTRPKAGTSFVHWFNLQ